MKKFLPEILVLCATIMAATYGFAQTWTKTTASTFAPFYMAVSADGRRILAIGSGTALSTNSGLAWAPSTPLPYGAGAGTSADGARMVASFSTNGGLGFIFCSTDSGNSWTQTILPLTNWQSCASSADGNKLAATVHNGLIYTSTNSGLTWLTNNVPAKDWKAITSSADGSRLAATANNDFIYLSTNSGSTWKPATGTSGAWAAICSSIDGLHLVATGGRTGISGDGGITWTFTNILGNGVACSADGSRLVVGYFTGAIYTSTNYGMNWASTNISGKQWYSMASSADGGELVAGENNGVWMRQGPVPPKLISTNLGKNLKISWLVPSTNFVLLGNTNLLTATWVAISNNPALNFSNLQNEVIVPATNRVSFYRLTTP